MLAPELRIHIEGPDAEALGEEMAQFLEQELGANPQRRSVAAARPETTRSIDPLALAAVVLALPSALLATADLAERLEVRARVDRLLAWVRERLKSRPDNHIDMVGADERALRLDRAASGEVIELAVELKVRVTRRSGEE